MNEQYINISKNGLSNIINEYNSDKSNYELEVIYNSSMNEKNLKRVLLYLNKQKNIETGESIKKQESYILDVYLVGIKNNRLSIASSDSNIINQHCVFENENMEDNTFFPNNYNLEFKELQSKLILKEIDSKINLKTEIIETDKEKKIQFIKIYSKLKKKYRFKKRLTYIFTDFNVDITIVKEADGQNILLSKINNTLEKIELEVELKKGVELTDNICKNMIEIMMVFNQFNNEGYFNINNKEKIDILKDYNILLIKNLQRNKKEPIGPKPLAFTKKTMLNMLDVKPEKKAEDKLYYKITEKADGERYFMYINNENVIYLVNDNNNVLKTGLQLSDEQYRNSVLDGELLYYKDEANKYKYEYRYFDVYIHNNTKVYTLVLDERIKIMTSLNQNIETNSNKFMSNDGGVAFINCIMKEYKELTEMPNIKKENYNYEIDGIILMPTLELANIDNVSYNYMLKYKPLEQNSVDLLYTNSILYCGYSVNNSYILSEIMNVKPYVVDIHKKPIKVFNKSGSGVEDIDLDLINNKIIEVVFNITYDCFIFLKIRYDKTEKYIREKKNSAANNFYIMNDIFEYSFNSVTDEEVYDINNEYINKIKQGFDKISYYNTENNNSNQAWRRLRKLQNKMKTHLINTSMQILENIPDFTFIKLLDIACGRGGDLYKYIETNFVDNNSNNNKGLKTNGGIQFILGVDIDSVGIEYIHKHNNNARGRFLQYKNEYMEKHGKSNLPAIYENNNVFYITGDINKYEKGDIVKVSYDNIMDNLMYTDAKTNELLPNNNDFEGRTVYDKKMLDDINTKYKSQDINLYTKEQFEFISCQFAIHYFDLSTFCKYINLQLKPSGIFMCTYMEKSYVNKLLDEKGEDGVVTGGFWSIRKSQTDPDTKIDVKFKTLGNDEYKEENLLSTEDVLKEFSRFNITPYMDPLSEASSNTSAINPIVDFKDFIFDTNKELEFNKLYRGIILQKNIPTSTKTQQNQSIIKQ